MPATSEQKNRPLGPFLLSFQDELIARMRWLIRIRWLAGIGVASTIIGATLLFELLVDPLPLLAVSAAIFLSNTGFVIWHRRLAGLSDRREQLHQAALLANLQISADLVILGVLIWLSGGAENPFFFYFIFHMVIASILLSTRASYLQASLAVALFVGMLAGEYLGWLPHHRLFPFFDQELLRHPLFLLGLGAVFSSTMFLTVYMATSITGKLRQREEELAEARLQVERANLELRRLHEHRSRFILKVEHELKAPLGAIQSLLVAVLTSLRPQLSDKVAELLERAVRRCENLLTMIQRLLELSRLQSAVHHYQFQLVDPARLIDRQCELMQPRAEEQGLVLKKEIAAPLPLLIADPEALEQVLTNLLSNAIKYTEQGEVRLRAEADQLQLRLEVSDTGIGMDEQELSQVFEEFFRSIRAKAGYEGTGLGLSIAREIVEAHGGRIEAVSSPGRGSTFTVTLPLSGRKD